MQRGQRDDKLTVGEKFTVAAWNAPGVSQYVDDYVAGALKVAGSAETCVAADVTVFSEGHGAQDKRRGRRGWVVSGSNPVGDRRDDVQRM